MNLVDVLLELEVVGMISVIYFISESSSWYGIYWRFLTNLLNVMVDLLDFNVYFWVEVEVLRAAMVMTVWIFIFGHIEKGVISASAFIGIVLFASVLQLSDGILIFVDLFIFVLNYLFLMSQLKFQFISGILTFFIQFRCFC